MQLAFLFSHGAFPYTAQSEASNNGCHCNFASVWGEREVTPYRRKLWPADTSSGWDEVTLTHYLGAFRLVLEYWTQDILRKPTRRHKSHGVEESSLFNCSVDMFLGKGTTHEASISIPFHTIMWTANISKNGNLKSQHRLQPWLPKKKTPWFSVPLF